jgi:hypothetical protein
MQDGGGGAFLAFTDTRRSPVFGAADVYAQRLSASGTAYWAAGGVPVCTAGEPGDEQTPQGIVFDGAGGVIISWSDYRWASEVGGYYMQRLDGGGQPLWQQDGQRFSESPGAPYTEMLEDGRGGVFFALADYVQRVDGSGNEMWPCPGVLYDTVATAGGLKPALVTDARGGVIVVWSGSLNGYTRTQLGQRISGEGEIQWRPGGNLLTASSIWSEYPRSIPDGHGGAIVTWIDYRDRDAVYAQHLLHNGETDPQWDLDGNPLSIGHDVDLPIEIVAAPQGLIAVWTDGRSYADQADIYAQRISTNGRLGLPGQHAPPVEPQTTGDRTALAVRTAGESVEVAFSLARPARVSLEVFDVAGRSVGGVRDRELSSGDHTLSWDARDASGRPVSPGVYSYALRTASGHVWTARGVIVRR